MEGEASRKVPGGKLVRARVRFGEEQVEEVKLTGDFFLYPEEALDRVEDAIAGKPVDADRVNLAETVELVLEDAGAQLVGIGPDDVAIAVRDAVEAGRT